MRYSVSVSVLFDQSASTVFAGLVSLDDYTVWSRDVTRVSKSGQMRDNMLIQFESWFMDRAIRSNVEVIKLEPNKSLELINNSGAITYRLLLQLLPFDRETEVICTAQFETTSFAPGSARQAIETMAESRIRENLESLRSFLNSDSD